MSTGSELDLAVYSKEQQDFLKDLFAAVSDGSGAITPVQLRQALSRQRVKPTQVQVERVWRNLDPNGIGRASFADFVRVLGDLFVQSMTPRPWKKVLDEAIELVDLGEHSRQMNLSSDGGSSSQHAEGSSEANEGQAHARLDPQLKFGSLQRLVSESQQICMRVMERLEYAEQDKDWASLETSALRPLRQRCLTLQECLQEETKRRESAESQVADLTSENKRLDATIQSLTQSMGMQDAAIKAKCSQLEGEVKRLEAKLAAMDTSRFESRVMHANEMAEHFKRSSQDAESLLQCTTHINEYLKQTQEDLMTRLDTMHVKLMKTERQLFDLQSKYPEYVECSTNQQRKDFSSTSNPFATDEDKPSYGSVLLALRTSERQVETLGKANQSLMQRLVSSWAMSAAAGNQHQNQTSNGYEKPDWVHASILPRDGADSMELAAFTPSVPEINAHPESHHALSKWIEQARTRLRSATVRHLAAQDGRVLGAEVYSSVAFSRLMQRATSITDDVVREAAFLQSGKNENSELAYQISQLLVDTASSIKEMNEVAKSVHAIAMQRLCHSNGDNVEDSFSFLSAIGIGGEEGENEESEGDSLWSLVSLSGLMGDFSASTRELQEDDDQSGAARMRALLQYVDRRAAKCKYEEENTRSVSGPRHPRHTSLSMFGIMTKLEGNHI